MNKPVEEIDRIIEELKRSAEAERKEAKIGLASGCAVILLYGTFMIAACYVAWHFISKLW